MSIFWRGLAGRLAVLVTLVTGAVSANAANYDSVTFTDVPVTQSTDLSLGTPMAHRFTVTGYTLGKVYFSGTVEEINGTTADFASENKVRVTFPDGRFTDVQFTTTTSYTGPLAFSGSFNVADGAVPPFLNPSEENPWLFQFVNTLDDAPTLGVPDAKVTVTFTLSDDATVGATPPTTSGDFGSYGTNASFTTLGGAHIAAQVRWYKLTLTQPISGTRYLDIDTETSTGITDSEVGIYKADGTFVATDDDDGSGNLSQLSFGPGGGSRTATGTSLAYNGRDGYLDAGVYYIAVGAFNTTFNPTNFSVTSAATTTGTINVRVRADGADIGWPPIVVTQDLGTFGTTTQTNTSVYDASNRIRWFKITLSEATGPRYLDIDTESFGAAGHLTDTEVAVYNSLGVKLFEDDEDGSGSLSQLTFGSTAGSRPAVGTGLAYNGRDGNLAAGIYYIAVGGFNCTFNNGFGATTTNTAATNNSIRLNVAANLTVAAPNTPPVLGAIGDQSVNEGAELTFTASATDPDAGAVVKYQLAGPSVPAGASINLTTGAFTWTPTEAQGPGSYTFWVVSQDNVGSVDAEKITVTVAEVATAPTLNAIGNQTIGEGNLLSFTATATDPDLPAQSLTFTLDAGAPAGASITSGGAFSWTPSEADGPGDYPVTVRVSDGSLEAFETINIHVDEVNVDPILDPIGNKTVNVNDPLSFTATASDSDLPAQALTFSLDAGAPAGASISSGGAFTWTPTAAGDYSVTVRVTDSMSGTDFETINIHVDSSNEAPVLGAIGNKSGDELALLTFTATVTDPNGSDTHTFSLDAGAPAGAAIDPSTGVFTWTPTEAQGAGDYTVTVRVTDNGTPVLDDFETITIHVDEVNVAPELGAIGNKTVNEGDLLTFTATATDADVPANTLTFSLDAGAPAGASIDANTGVFTWTPTEAQGAGDFSVTVRVTDNGSPALDDFETISIHVDEVNVAPELGVIGNKSVDENTLLSFTATATDADLPANTLTYSLDAGAPAGASIDANTGAFTWTPGESAGGNTFNVTIRVTDNGSPALDDFETITITVADTNENPVLGAIGNSTINEEQAYTFTATATDSDLPADTLTFSLTGAPAGASIDTNTGVFTWTPDESTGGNAFTFDVVVSDGNGGTDSETITLTVSETVKTFTGHVDLMDFDYGDVTTQPVTIEIRMVGSTTPIITQVVNLDGSGNFSFGSTDVNLPAGTYDITAKASLWLRKKLGSVVVSPTGATGLSYTLLNGDSNDDNTVDIADYAILSAAYGSSDGDMNWDARADYNGDLTIDIADYAILSANYGLSGDD